VKFLVYLSSAIRHAVRSKLVVVLFVFTAVIEYSLLKVLQATTLQVQGDVSALSQTDLVFSGLIVQIFTGLLLALVYGLWMIPYPHRGSRSTLTYALPISRTAMVVSYSTTLLLLLGMQTLITVACLGAVAGWSFVFSAVFPWKKLLLAFLFQGACFQFLASMLAVGALSFGQVVTFVLGTMLFVLLQVAGGLLRIEMVQVMGAAVAGFETAQKIYVWLPPVGEFLYQLRELFWSDGFSRQAWLSWGAWWLLAHTLLTARLKFPSIARSEE
jgi:hypothetical protein